MKVGWDGLIKSIHDAEEAAVLSKISAVTENVLDAGEMGFVFWALIEPIIFNAFDFG